MTVSIRVSQFRFVPRSLIKDIKAFLANERKQEAGDVSDKLNWETTDHLRITVSMSGTEALSLVAALESITERDDIDLSEVYMLESPYRILVAAMNESFVREEPSWVPMSLPTDAQLFEIEQRHIDKSHPGMTCAQHHGGEAMPGESEEEHFERLLGSPEKRAYGLKVAKETFGVEYGNVMQTARETGKKLIVLQDPQGQQVMVPVEEDDVEAGMGFYL